MKIKRFNDNERNKDDEDLFDRASDRDESGDQVTLQSPYKVSFVEYPEVSTEKKCKRKHNLNLYREG